MVDRWWRRANTRPFEKDTFKEVLDVVLGRPIQDSLAALICHGVFDRHPGVRVASLENGSAWLEPLLKRLESAFHKMPREFKEHPVETFNRHIYIAPFYEDPVKKVMRTGRCRSRAVRQRLAASGRAGEAARFLQGYR